MTSSTGTALDQAPGCSVAWTTQQGHRSIPCPMQLCCHTESCQNLLLATAPTRMTCAAKQKTEHSYLKNSCILVTAYIHVEYRVLLPSWLLSGERFRWEVAGPQFLLWTLAGWPCKCCKEPWCNLPSQVAHCYGTTPMPIRYNRQTPTCQKNWGTNAKSCWFEQQYSTRIINVLTYSVSPSYCRLSHILVSTAITFSKTACSDACFDYIHLDKD